TGSDDRVAANADTGGLADIEPRKLPHRFVGKGARARHDADVSGFVDVPRHNTDFAFAGSDYSGTVGSNEARRGLRFQVFMHLDHVGRRNPFGDTDDQRQAGIGGFHDGVGGKRRRNEYHRCIRTGLAHRIGNGIENGKLQVLRTAFAGRNAAHYFRAVSDCLLGVKCALPAGEALKDDFGVFVDEYAHCASLTTFSAASFMPSATVKFNPDSLRSCCPSSTLVPSMRTTTGILISSSRAAAITPLASVSQRRMPPKILINTAFTLGSDNRMRNAFLTCSALAPPPTSRKFAGCPPAYLMMSMVAIASPAPFTMHAMLPSSLM